MKTLKNKNLIKIYDGDNIFSILDYNFLEHIDSDLIFYTLIVKKDDTILYSNDKFNFAISCDVINKKLSDILCKDTYESIRKMILKTIFTNNQNFDDILILNKIFKVIVSPILEDDSVKYLFINAIDYSKNYRFREEIEDLKTKLNESNSVKSMFLANISHELRTPLNAIIGFSDTLQYNHSKEQLERCMKSINTNAKYLDELLNNILDYAKIESNEFDIIYENFYIDDLFDDLSDIVDDLNRKKNYNLVKLEFIKGDNKKIISDLLRLKQLLFNIISNSIKFTSSGYIKISYEFTDNSITFIIEDTGIGIPEDKIDFIFDRFYQLDSSSTKQYKGTGLGLSIVKHIVETLSGKIWLKSTLKKGTTFYVQIPLEEYKQEEIYIDLSKKTNFSGKTILIIDELPINYSLLGMYLNSMNIEIIAAYSGEEALKICTNLINKIELIFVDLNLPDFNVNELSKKLKNIYNYKIISKSGVDDFKNEYIDFHLKKPINKDKLLLILNEIWPK